MHGKPASPRKTHKRKVTTRQQKHTHNPTYHVFFSEHLLCTNLKKNSHLAWHSYTIRLAWRSYGCLPTEHSLSSYTPCHPTKKHEFLYACAILLAVLLIRNICKMMLRICELTWRQVVVGTAHTTSDCLPFDTSTPPRAPHTEFCARMSRGLIMSPNCPYYIQTSNCTHQTWQLVTLASGHPFAILMREWLTSSKNNRRSTLSNVNKTINATCQLYCCLLAVAMPPNNCNANMHSDMKNIRPTTRNCLVRHTRQINSKILFASHSTKHC